MKKFQLHKLYIIRRLVSFAFFAFFIWIIANIKYETVLYNNHPANLFLKIDPLIALATFVSSKSIEISFLIGALSLIIITLVVGRLFCSWICPLGFLNKAISFIRFRKSNEEFHPVQNFKYFFLGFLLILALFGFQAIGLFDPIALTSRSISIIFTENKFESVYTIIIIVIFILILLANIFKKNFWCNYLCPLGALLGIIANFSVFKIRPIQDKCLNCKVCSVNCIGNANPHKANEFKFSECNLCMLCLDKCPANSITYNASKNILDANFQAERRALLATGIISFLSIPFLNSFQRIDNKLIRPPGSAREDLFLSKCINCGLCADVCPNNAIKMAVTESGFEGIFTPYIEPRENYCELMCNACSEVCPTDAINSIDIKDRGQIAMGKAVIRKGRCYAYRDNQHCLQCESVCPLADKAIKVINQNGVGKPVVDYSLCVGCGACENICPAEPAAIIVSPDGADRF